MTDPLRFYGGINFSGAREPLSTLWSAVGREHGGKLHIVALCPHAFRSDLCGYAAGGWRGPAGARPDAPILWGADFPFSLPAAAARHATGSAQPTWAETVAWVADRPPDEVREALGEWVKTPRGADTGGAMAPLDLRLYKQTVEGMRWLQELRETVPVSVLPQAAAPDASTTLIEVYPSATIVDLGIRCRRTPSRPGEVRARPAALRPFVTFENPSIETIAVTLEDAWDATIACLTAWLARDDLDQPRRFAASAESLTALEGWIFHAPAALG